MPALRYLAQMLSTFRPLFARHLPWTMFLKCCSKNVVEP